MRWAALLRGVNVGGNRKLPMKDLRALLEDELGYSDVTTLLASGNVVFTAPERSARKVEAAIERALHNAGVETDVLVRSKAQLAAILARDPFADARAAHPNHLIVLFHRDAVPAAKLKTLEPPGGERLHAHGHELYIDYVGGMGKSKLPAAMAKAKFPKCATGRNWNTVVKLHDLL